MSSEKVMAHFIHPGNAGTLEDVAACEPNMSAPDTRT